MISHHYNFSISHLLDLVKDEPQKISLYKLNQLNVFKEHLAEIMDNLEDLNNAIKAPGFINKDIDASAKELNNFIELLKNIINPRRKKTHFGWKSLITPSSIISPQLISKEISPKQPPQLTTW